MQASGLVEVVPVFHLLHKKSTHSQVCASAEVRVLMHGDNTGPLIKYKKRSNQISGKRSALVSVVSTVVRAGSILRHVLTISAAEILNAP